MRVGGGKEGGRVSRDRSLFKRIEEGREVQKTNCKNDENENIVGECRENKGRRMRDGRRERGCREERGKISKDDAGKEQVEERKEIEREKRRKRSKWRIEELVEIEREKRSEEEVLTDKTEH